MRKKNRYLEYILRTNICARNAARNVCNTIRNINNEINFIIYDILKKHLNNALEGGPPEVMN